MVGQIERKTEYGLKKRVSVGGSRLRKRQKLARRGVFWGGALLENPRISNGRGAQLGGLVVGEIEEKTEYGMEKRMLGGW